MKAVKLTASSITAPVQVVNGVLVLGDMVYEIKGNYDKYGNSKEFIIDSEFDVAKSVMFTVAGDYVEKKYPGAITIITEAGIITAINTGLDKIQWKWEE